ncbi:MAG TPA: hypothetical protein VNO86_04890 [Candidatus Binatia bacterium]|nr:hypothetical protein [Candidatus Binatia bacterium]
MAQAQQLGPGKIRKRALFGLLDADGWSWASIKAFFWFIVIILMLGYLPDRAYYFTVFPTIDLGVLVWSPVNLCPPENGENMPCPVPAGAPLPWQPSPAELGLPEPRIGGAVVQVGTQLLYIGGSNGSTATSTVYVARLVDGSTFDRWSEGPALPEPRANAAVAFFGGSVYVIGGTDASGAPTATTFVLTPDLATGELGTWTTNETLALPEPRTEAAVVAAPTGLILVGGSGPSGPVDTVWRSALERNALAAWQPQAPLARPQSGGVAMLAGDYLWYVGGRDASGPVGAVQRGEFGTDEATAGSVVRWGIRNDVNLPAPRAELTGFTTNGVLYAIGGFDGQAPRGEVYWAVPDSRGEIAEWKHLAQSDLPPVGLAGAASVVSGSHAFVIGGRTADGLIGAAARTNLAPQPPFFQLGLFGIVVPALKIEGEIGQQLGYLNAAGVGTLNFIILVLIGWAYAHPDRAREIARRVLRRGRSAA